MCFSALKKNMKHHRLQSLKPFPFKPSWTSQHTSSYSCTLSVLNPWLSQKSFPCGKAEPSVGILVALAVSPVGAVLDFGKEGGSQTARSVRPVIFIWLCGCTSEPWTNVAIQVWTCVFQGLESMTLWSSNRICVWHLTNFCHWRSELMD